MTEFQKGLCSVCCVSYNHVKYLSDTIRSIWEGNYKNVEIIALDDGSTDGSGTLLTKLSNESKIPMDVVIQNNSGNIGKNFNTVMKLAKGEFISLISMDDYLYPSALSTKIQRMTDNDNIAFIANSIITVIDSKGTVMDQMIRIKSPKTVNIEDLLDLEYNTGSFFIQGCVFRSDITRIIGGFDEDMIGDDIVFRTKFFRYIKEHPNYNFIIDDDAACYYRMHDNNVHKNATRQIRIISAYLLKYWPDRELPSTYIQWAINMITFYPFEEYMNEILYNTVSIKLIYNPKIRRAIKNSQNFPMKWKINRILFYILNNKYFKWLKFIYQKFFKVSPQ